MDDGSMPDSVKDVLPSRICHIFSFQKAIQKIPVARKFLPVVSEYDIQDILVKEITFILLVVENLDGP